MSNEHRRLARKFRALHGSGRIIVLPNVFDVASARLAARRRPVAIGTTSGGIAWSHGYPDGERIPRDEMLATVERIVSAVDVGVTVDIEGGYGPTREATAETVQAVIELGGIGVNIEDTAAEGAGEPLLPVEQAASKIAAARETASQAGIELVINARTDVFLAGVGGNENVQISLAIARGNHYLAAGADCVFVPGAVQERTIAALTAGIRGPVNVYVLPGVPHVPDLERLGVARVSVGAGPYQACLALLDEAFDALLEHGNYEPVLRRQVSIADAQELLASRHVSTAPR